MPSGVVPDGTIHVQSPTHLPNMGRPHHQFPALPRTIPTFVANIKTIRHILNPNKLNLMRHLTTAHAPRTARDLAIAVRRARSPVMRDLKALASHGFVRVWKERIEGWGPELVMAEGRVAEFAIRFDAAAQEEITALAA
jgi:predicted transcriptional regulator